MQQFDIKCQCIHKNYIFDKISWLCFGGIAVSLLLTLSIDGEVVVILQG